MGHPTDADVFDTLVAFAKSIGMVALPLKKNNQAISSTHYLFLY
jgi:hypothetical protein